MYDHDEEEGIRKLQALLGELDSIGPTKSGAGGVEPLIQAADVLAFLFEHLAKVERWKQVCPAYIILLYLYTLVRVHHTIDHRLTRQNL